MPNIYEHLLPIFENGYQDYLAKQARLAVRQLMTAAITHDFTDLTIGSIKRPPPDLGPQVQVGGPSWDRRTWTHERLDSFVFAAVDPDLLRSVGVWVCVPDTYSKQVYKVHADLADALDSDLAAPVLPRLQADVTAVQLESLDQFRRDGWQGTGAELIETVRILHPGEVTDTAARVAEIRALEESQLKQALNQMNQETLQNLAFNLGLDPASAISRYIASAPGTLGSIPSRASGAALRATYGAGILKHVPGVIL